jgi:DNA-binding beta-propeller fold protein YncE
VRPHLLALTLVGAAAAGGIAIAATSDDNAVGPDVKTTVQGRRLSPFGGLVGIGNFPTGGATTRDGRFYWTVSTGRGRNDIRIVDVAQGKVVQILPMPGASGGIAMDPSSDTAYVSGVADSPYTDQKSPDGTPGTEGDVVHVFTYDATTGQAKFDRVIAVPPPSTAPPVQDFPPGAAQRSWPDRLAVSRDGATLLVPLNLADAAAIVDTKTGTVKNVNTGAYPFGAAILPDSKTGLVSNEADGTVSVIDLASGQKTKDITVGPHLSHPENITVDPNAPRAYVPLANSDEVAVIDTEKLTVAKTLSVERPEGLGTSPVDTAVTRTGRLLVAEPGADEISVFRLPGSSAPQGHKVKRVRSPKSIARYVRLQRAAKRRLHGRAYLKRLRVLRRKLVYGPAITACAGPTAAQERRYISTVRRAQKLRGKRKARAIAKARRRLPAVRTCAAVAGDYARVGAIPTAAQPYKVDTTADGHLLYVSAKGLGVGPNPNGPQPNSPNDSDNAINATQYLPVIVSGMAGIGKVPDDARVAAMTPAADRQAVPVNSEQAPADTPVRPDGPIKHVFYIVKENRTYDQILGDDPRGDGDPKLTLFGGDTTPNVHALVKRFPLLDHVFANSEASIDGHFWTSAGSVPDYVNRNWWPNYGGRGRPYDFPVYAIAWPSNGFLFDQATRDKISYYDYGEAIAGNIPLTDRNRTPQQTSETAAKFANSDIQPGIGTSCYPNDGSVGIDAVNRQPVFDTMPPVGAPPQAESRFRCFQMHFTQQLATNSVPTFNYLVLSNNHTRVLSPGAYTPRAMIADNDEALGRIVDLISHSSIWSSSAIFVIEDDSQDGADHVDAHRIPANVFSPYARPNAVVHTRYDFLSVIRTMQLIMGMKSLGFQDAVAVPMYDAFQATPANSAPFTFIPAKVDLLEKNPATGPGARASLALPRGLDRIPQRKLDALLWKSIHGWESTPPPPGPNASGLDEAAEEDDDD